MTRRGRLIGVVLAALSPAIAHSQGLEIDHKAVGCIVVGKFPKMNACFAPAANLARSRVYFRPEGTPTWYRVDMKSDQPCFSGILPKPGKKLVGKKVEYYLEAQNKAFDPSRTAEYTPIVVRSAQECKKDIPIAPFVNNATVAVFPSVPAGFVGSGIGTTAVVGIVAAGAAVASTAAVVASNDNDTTTTTVAIGGNTTTTVAPTTTIGTTTTTTTLPTTNRRPNAVLRTNPDPPQGTGPLTVTFDMCQSSDPDGDPLSFFFSFGDGSQASGGCIQSHTYSATFRGASRNVRALDRSYTFEGSAVDPGGLSQSRTRTVVATSAPTPPPPSACVAPPPPTITSPSNGACGFSGDVNVNVTATDPQGISNVEVKGIHVGNTSGGGVCTPAGPTPEDTKTATGGPPNFSATLTSPPLVPPSSFAKCYDIAAIVTNSCGMQSNSKISYFVAQSSCYPYPYFRDVRRALAWSSDLEVEGGRLQLVVNGSSASYPGAGQAYGMAGFVDGQNRVEATLVEGRGKVGLWRFDFMGSQAIAPGSIRVFAGDVVTIAGSSVTFRLRGTPGERIAFTFDRK